MSDTAMAAKRHPLLDPKVLLRGLVMIVTLAGVGYLLEGVGLRSMFDSAWVDHEIRGQGLLGEALFLLVGAGVVALGLPRQAVCFLGGYAFGFVFGTVLALAATLLGSLSVFYYARFMGRDFLLRRFPGQTKRLDEMLAGNPLVAALILRLFPLSNGLAVNIGAGVSGVKAIPFFVGSLLGYLPQTLIFTVLGGGMELAPVANTILSAALFVVSSILGFWLWRRYRVRHGLSVDENEES
ncbi:VTT domain-containing protein [Magnetospirillum sp. 64-120]|uniref:TVP38/TMEM64 family protein n=1 Tax=Magnetospirillum sp. 64-120 TaxID=1895778 RepID=UPI0025B89DC6|nr:VTT domain-containing protein [Magnetospirillum sp. 64-120]